MSRAAAHCTICRHPKRAQIEIALTYQTPLRVVAARFECSPDGLWRHSRNHLSAQMRAAILTAKRPTEIDLDALRVSEAEGLLSQLVHQRARLQQHLDMAMEVGNLQGAVQAERVVLSNLETVGKLLGTLAQHHVVTTHNVLISEDYIRLRQVLIATLRPFPDAARAVGAALAALEADAARDITHRAAVSPPAAPHPALPLVIEHAPSA